MNTEIKEIKQIKEIERESNNEILNIFKHF